MTHDEDVLRTLRAYADDKLTEDGIVEALVAGGASRVLAEKLNVLVPLAFGRVLISHVEKVEFRTTAFLFCRDGSTRAYDLSSDEVFQCALQTATTMYHEGPRELFQPAAARSHEVNAVNNALKAGAELSGARFSEPHFFRISYEEWTGLPDPPLQTDGASRRR